MMKKEMMAREGQEEEAEEKAFNAFHCCHI